MSMTSEIDHLRILQNPPKETSCQNLYEQCNFDLHFDPGDSFCQKFPGSSVNVLHMHHILY